MQSDNLIQNKNVSRRGFIKTSLAVSTGLLFPSIFTNTLFSGSYPVIAKVKGKHIEKAAKRVINVLGGMKNFIKKGHVVFIKPNAGLTQIKRR